MFILFINIFIYSKYLFICIAMKLNKRKVYVTMKNKYRDNVNKNDKILCKQKEFNEFNFDKIF